MKEPRGALVVSQILACALAVACTRTSPSGDARAPDRSMLRAKEPGAPDVPWSRKTRDERMEYMGLYVFPRVRAVFRGFDGKAYKSFRCQTCHGSDMEAVDYKMPNGLYALPAEGAEKAALDYDEKTARFMIDTVLPTFRELMAKNEPARAAVFGCQSCHPKE